MRDFRDAKAMARTLRAALKAKSVSLTQAESLELIAKVLGWHDWNVLSAKIQSERPTPVREPADLPPITAGAQLPTLPLRDVVLFPKMTMPVFVGRAGSKRAVEHAVAGDGRILVVTQRRAADDNPSLQGLYRVGVAASVISQITLDETTTKLMVKGLERVAIVQLAEGQFLMAEVAPLADARGQDADAVAVSRAVLEEFPAYRNADLSHWPYSRLPQIREPGELADAVAPLLLVGIDRRQDLLETGDVISRLEKILVLMKGDRQAA